ncbi:MAG: adenylate/guanylate cyclase domain-containing protein [Hyphomicrobiales bacterium]|nr:adenylate/guanylate cyclase domain-containing protein [Hyphomicrobiales bacterium]
MQLSVTLTWLVDAAGGAASADRFLAQLGQCLIEDGVPLAGGALTLAVPHPLIAKRTWLWRAESGEVIEALGFAAGGLPVGEPANQDRAGDSGKRWLTNLATGGVLEVAVGPGPDGASFSWVGPRPFTPQEAIELRQAARFATAPLAALTARATLASALEAYLGRRSAARVLAGPLRRVLGETIQAALLFGDLRGFTPLSESHSPSAVISALDAWFDRIAGAVHAFGGEVLKFIGDGVLAIFPVAGGPPRAACEAALRAVSAARVGMAHLDEARRQQGHPPLPFGVALHLGEILWGNIGAADRLDFTAIGPAVNLVTRLEGLCRPLGKLVLVSGAFAAETEMPLVPLGTHALRGIASPCAVFTVPQD